MHIDSPNRYNIISVSGGKDSTALLLLAIEMEVPNLRAVFADTGNEHQHKYDYVHYVANATGDIWIMRVTLYFLYKSLGENPFSEGFIFKTIGSRLCLNKNLPLPQPS